MEENSCRALSQDPDRRKTKEDPLRRIRERKEQWKGGASASAWQRKEKIGGRGEVSLS